MFSAYAEATSCATCHTDLYKTHMETAHFNTSAYADSMNILGSFDSNDNVLDLRDVAFTMFKKEDGYYQKTDIKNRKVVIPDKRLDLVIGSGVRGQSYLSWAEDELYQLQVSYHKDSDTWINGIGYPEYFVERPIRDACINCHLTFAQNTGRPKGNSYRQGSLLLGIDCQKCHGPSKKHVDYHSKNNVAEAKYIVKFDTLNQQQRLDMCAQCHSGQRRMLTETPFSFLPGDNLEEHSQAASRGETKTLDVHGNQYGLLISSECFKQSPGMDCMTCHNPHKNQRSDVNHFNQQCINCHFEEEKTCSSMDFKSNADLKDCVSCHMPLIPSETMAVKLGEDGVSSPLHIRTHLIDVYPEENK